MKIRHAVMLAAALTIPLAACSDDSGGGRPTAAELESAIFDQGGLESDDGGIVDEMVSCMAQGMVDSDISDDVLRAIADGKEDDVSEEDQETAEAALEEVSTKCTTEAMSG